MKQEGKVLLGPVKIFKHIFEKAGVQNIAKLYKLKNWSQNCLSPAGFLHLVDYRKQPDLVASFDKERAEHSIIPCARNNLTLSQSYDGQKDLFWMADYRFVSRPDLLQ